MYDAVDVDLRRCRGAGSWGATTAMPRPVNVMAERWRPRWTELVVVSARTRPSAYAGAQARRTADRRSSGPRRRAASTPRALDPRAPVAGRVDAPAPGSGRLVSRPTSRSRASASRPRAVAALHGAAVAARLRARSRRCALVGSVAAGQATSDRDRVEPIVDVRAGPRRSVALAVGSSATTSTSIVARRGSALVRGLDADLVVTRAACRPGP